MDFDPVSPVLIAVRTIIESSGLDATDALLELDQALTRAARFDRTFKVFPIPYHLSVAKPKPWINHGIVFADSDQAIVISCKAHTLHDRVLVTLVEKRLLQGAPQQPPVRRTPSVRPESVDLS